jgi:hypothetical protein
LTYDDLAKDLDTRFPPLRQRLREEQALWDPDAVGGDILLADIFVPFFVDALRSLPGSRRIVDEASGFVEDLSTSDDQSLRNAVRISILQALEDYPDELATWARELGPSSRAMLPTRRDQR